MGQSATKEWVYVWYLQAETMPRAELKALQTLRLQQQVTRAYNRAPFYRHALEGHGIHPQDIQTINNIERLPFTVKDDFRTTYPYGLFAVPLKDVVRLHASSGYGLFTGGLGAHIGAELIGATVLPISGGLTRRQVQLMEVLKVNVFPTQIVQVLLSHPGLTSNCQIIVERQHDQLDELEVRVEADEALHHEGGETLSLLQANVNEDLRQNLGLHAQVQIVEPYHLPRSEGKVKRVVDRRQLSG